ncbi:MAG: ribonucleoside-diphosphate reductase subunit alpha [Rhizobiales bacterium]|nr:ribonucleoside-diphosphate reductase subunit alpha [Hyphomicrobiales bacterium]
MNGTNTINVTKRDGTIQPFDLDKVHKVLEWAVEDISGVSMSEIELKANIQLYDKIPAYDIHELLIKSTAELISDHTPNYQFVAARLISYKMRKEAYGDYEVPSLWVIINRNVQLGVYDKEILNIYTDEEIQELNEYIKHERDDTFTYAGMEQFRGKYLVQDRRTKQIYETPQILYMMIAMTLFGKYKDNRIKFVKDYYDAISQFYISLPTPIMAGVRTPTRQFSSCVLIESGDSLDSINATATSIVRYISKKAGIGIGVGSIRANGAKVGDGSVVHTGLIPFLKYFQSAVKSCSQGGVRGGAATVYLPLWHYEFEDLVVLKNNKGTDESRVRHMDYAFQFNKLMYERLLSGGNITFFDPNDVPGLYEAFFANQDEFDRLYEKYERKTSIRKKTLPALEVFQQFLTERKDTGRIYLMNVDHANDHGSFKPEVAPIRMSNLCCEIDLPTRPLNNHDDTEGEISLCTLSAINWGLIHETSEFEKYCDLTVRALDELLDYQGYPIPAAEQGTLNRRPLGVGIINLAYFLAKRGLKYDESAYEIVDEYAEAWSYYLIKSSANLAAEKGKLIYNTDTKYSDGILPIDTYKRAIDNLIVHRERLPWEDLRKQLRETGIRNSTLMALMPAETSAQISNSTNGIEPPRALVSYKQSKDGVMAQVVPGYHHLKNKYDLLWDQKSPAGYLAICGILQKYIDQGISVNTSYNPEHFEDHKIPMSVMITDLVTAYKYGLKQLYYFNTFDGAGEITDGETHHAYDGEAETYVEDDEDCDSCKI